MALCELREKIARWLLNSLTSQQQREVPFSVPQLAYLLRFKQFDIRDWGVPTPSAKESENESKVNDANSQTSADARATSTGKAAGDTAKRVPFVIKDSTGCLYLFPNARFHDGLFSELQYGGLFESKMLSDFLAIPQNTEVPLEVHLNSLYGRPADGVNSKTTNNGRTVKVKAMQGGQGLRFTIARPDLARLVLNDVIKLRERYGLSSALHTYVARTGKSVLSVYATSKASAGPNGNANRPETVLVDYSSPNIAKPFHAGHLRSTLVGHFVANTNRLFGNRVVAVNYLGDWGTQFGLLSVGFEKRGDAALLERASRPDANDADRFAALSHLMKVYVEANRELDAKWTPADESAIDRVPVDVNTAAGTVAGDAYRELRAAALRRFASLERSDDSQLTEFWRRVRALSLRELETSYQKFGIAFDAFEYESEYVDKARDVLRLCEQRGLLRDDNGLKFIEQDSLELSRILTNAKARSKRNLDADGDEESERASYVRRVPLQKSDGSSLYLTRDVAAAIDRHERYRYDRVHYVVDKTQGAHFDSLRYILAKVNKQQVCNAQAPWPLHVRTGKILGMSTRLGNAVLLKDIVETCIGTMKQAIVSTKTTRVSAGDVDQVAAQLAIIALVTQVFSWRRKTDVEFNWRTMLSMDSSDNGVSLNYCFSRLNTLYERACEAGLNPRNVELLNECDDELYERALGMDTLTMKMTSNLLCHLARFDEVLNEAYSDLEPNHLMLYACKLAHAINRCYSKLKVVGIEDKAVAELRLLLLVGAGDVLQSVMRAMLVEPIKKM